MAQQVSTGELAVRLLASLLVIGALLGMLVLVARRRSGFGGPPRLAFPAVARGGRTARGRARRLPALVASRLSGGSVGAGRSSARSGGSRMRPAGARLGSRRAERPLEVLDRQALSRTASMAVVRVGRRALLVGATEASLSVLADVSDEVEPPPTDDRGGGDDDGEAERAALEDLLRQWTGAPVGPSGPHPSGMELVEAVFQRFGLPS